MKFVRKSFTTVLSLLALTITIMILAFNYNEVPYMTPLDVKLFSETFGDKKNPAIILNAGAGMQAMSWPDILCEKLAAKGYYVIRYDYRDTGLSSAINYDKNPYTVMDLANDALHVLDNYQIKKAHFIGYSMGGQLAQFAGAYFPDRTQSLILIASSSNFKPSFDALDGKHDKNSLSGCDPEYVKWAIRPVDFANQSLEEKVNDYVKTRKLLDGNSQNFDEDFFRKQGRLNFIRTKLQQPFISHAKAMRASFEIHSKALALIKQPTLIIQGRHDPVFPVDHGYDLKNKISNSQLMILDDLAHVISPRNTDSLVGIIDEFIVHHATK